jgi:hypothetical protein
MYCVDGGGCVMHGQGVSTLHRRTRVVLMGENVSCRMGEWHTQNVVKERMTRHDTAEDSRVEG